MRPFIALTAAVLAVSLGACATTSSTEKASKQAEVRKATQASLQKFYQADPKLQSEVAKAPGYGIFTTYGLSFIIGGAGGSGLVHNNHTQTDTFMDEAQASAGVQAGIAQTDTLIVFKTQEAMQKFVESGWVAGGGGVAQAGAKGESVGPGTGGNVIADATYYTLTPNGLQAGFAGAGTKFWKSKDLN
ncbi:MAG TPA: YSC84-related protein [Burkholderiales bacterium]|nr:YSC84-related protein [Burkholderiales bacterium]